ncbi:hypothetical protein Tco_1463437, partial [Tanacetum coccineum]
VESVGSYFLRVILIGSIFVEVPVAPEVGAAVVASPTEVLELDTYSSLEVDPSKSLLPPVSVAPMVSPFLCLDDSESDTEMPERHNPTAPITTSQFVVVAPSTNIISPVDAPSGIRRRHAILIRPGQDIPIGQLYRTHLGGPCKGLTARKLVRPLPSHRLALRYTSHHLDRFTSGSSSDHSSSDHSSSGYSISGLHGVARPITIGGLPYYLPCIHRRMSPELSRKRCMSPAATVTSSIYATRALVPSRADLLPPRKRFRDSILLEDSVEEDIDANELADIKANATADEDEVEDEVESSDKGTIESSDKGTIEVGVDVVDGIDNPDGMLIPDAVKHLEQVEEGLQDIYEHVMEIPLQRIEDIKMGQREFEARSLFSGRERASLLDQVASLERSNARLRGTLRMERARADRFRQCMSFIESELRQIRRFRYYDRMRFRILETFAVRRLVAISRIKAHRVLEVLAAYEATRAANALEAESQRQNGSDGDNVNGGNRNGGDGNGRDGNGG